MSDIHLNPAREAEAPRQIGEARQAEFVRMMATASTREFSEAMTTSDFPILLQSTLDGYLQAQYAQTQKTWTSWCRRGTVQDFRTSYVYKIWGGARLQKIGELGEYPATSMSEGRYPRTIDEYGRVMKISWKSIINDRLGAFRDLGSVLLAWAIEEETRLASGLLAISSGPNTALFGATVSDAADAQAVTNKGSLALSIANLETTVALVRSQTNKNGSPITLNPKYLIVPPALEMTARNILSSATVIAPSGKQGANNVIPQIGLELVVDPFLPILDTTKGGATWYLVCAPSGNGAALAEMTFLAGREAPQVRMKASNVEGGSPYDGSFENKTVEFRVEHLMGANPLDPRCAYAQTGS